MLQLCGLTYTLSFSSTKREVKNIIAVSALLRPRRVYARTIRLRLTSVLSLPLIVPRWRSNRRLDRSRQPLDIPSRSSPRTAILWFLSALGWNRSGRKCLSPRRDLPTRRGINPSSVRNRSPLHPSSTVFDVVFIVIIINEREKERREERGSEHN